MRVLVLLDLAGTLGRRFNFCGARLTASLDDLAFAIQQGEDIRQGLAVFGHQLAEFGFEVQLLLQFVILLEGLQALLQLLDGGFGRAEFVDQGHCRYLGKQVCRKYRCGRIIGTG
ncbi:hypothetical protein D3C80_1362360 [compost metagenome]